MHPDFVLFHQTDNGIRPSIVDPHGYHLVDAADKLRGLTEYADRHGDSYARVDAVIQDTDGRLLALNLKSRSVRDAVFAYRDTNVLRLSQEQGGSYT
jgi:hypothetical protein